METISLFPQGAFEPVERKADKAISAILTLFHAGHPTVIAFSGGKDSSAVAALVLHAALLHKASGGSPIVVATTGDTLVESRISMMSVALADKFLHDGQTKFCAPSCWPRAAYIPSLYGLLVPEGQLIKDLC
ncbi:hypothetical protein [Cupriavidus sp. YR651]|uniref:hypothetical protein n=1 Tax=Cupriavidus sp. YR651 TaxID=1855315 RepID=UPI0015A39EE1|nr:hypothetical protein [Cupriavidus sp. YR651]